MNTPHDKNSSSPAQNGTVPWHTVFEQVSAHIVRIITPRGNGTGFLLAHSANGRNTVVATAAHVIGDSYYWREPIRLEHHKTGKVVYLEHDDRGIIIDAATDTAVIAFAKGQLPLPETPMEFITKGKILKIGHEVAWFGFPSLENSRLCFFAGNISCSLGEQDAYLLDGVVINGVSGGPVIAKYSNGVSKVIGVISAYRPNWATGNALPGLGVASEVTAFYEVIENLRNLKDAETAPTTSQEPPPPADGQQQPKQTAARFSTAVS